VEGVDHSNSSDSDDQTISREYGTFALPLVPRLQHEPQLPLYLPSTVPSRDFKGSSPRPEVSRSSPQLKPKKLPKLLLWQTLTVHASLESSPVLRPCTSLPIDSALQLSPKCASQVSQRPLKLKLLDLNSQLASSHGVKSQHNTPRTAALARTKSSSLSFKTLTRDELYKTVLSYKIKQHPPSKTTPPDPLHVCRRVSR
jgi:hypothetical protein